MADYEQMLQVALQEARAGREEGGIPIGAALFHADGTLLGRGHNRRMQDDDPSVHGETDAFRNAGRRRSYRDLAAASLEGEDLLGADFVPLDLDPDVLFAEEG